MKKIYTLLIISITFFAACRSAGKAFDKGNYEDAVSLAVKKLQKDAGDDEAKAILKDAYTQLVNEHESRISTLNNSAADSRYEKIYAEYRNLQNLYESINNSPAALKILTPVDYSSYVQTYKEKTGDVYYEKGLALMDRGDKASYRAAYREFKTAARYKNTAELERKIEEAYNGSVVRVLIVANDQFNGYNNNYGGYTQNTSYQFRNFQDEIIRNLRYQNSDQFVEFITEFEARNKNMPIDEVVELRLNNFDLGRYYDDRSSRDVSKQVVIKETVYRPDSIVKQYATVSARITTTRRTYSSGGSLDIISRDGEGKYLWSDVVRSEYRTQTEFATYTGDERALSASDLALLNQRPGNYNQSSQNDVMNELLRQIQQETAQKFRNYFGRYSY